MLLAAPVVSEELRLTVYTDPPGATVSNNFDALGVSGVELPIDPKGREVLELTVEKPGWKSAHFSLSVESIRETPFYPREEDHAGVLQLQPASVGAYLFRFRWWVGGLLGLVLLAAPLIWFQHRLRQRALALIALTAAAPSSGGSPRPKRVGPYTVLDELGRGGMATVYAGRHEQDKSMVAIKILHSEVVADPGFQARFHREVSLSARLTHPSIAQVYDSGEQRGMSFLIMELVEGGSLRAALRPQGMTKAEALEVLVPLFDAIAYAHRCGVVHRDLKPDNVLLTKKGKVKVTDFGLARHLDSDTLTATGTALGTPAYMAPEQVQGVHFDFASDQYALGIIAFEGLVGQRPFDAENPMEVVFMHLTELPQNPCELRRGLPDQVGAVVLKMLEKAPEDRFPDVAQAGEALREALEGWT